MKTTISKTHMGSRGNPEKSRAAILEAAVHEFSREGIAGARTDAIADRAGVNKALLYYYFKDKETLYGAVLDQAFGGLITTALKVLDRDLPPREKLLAYAGTHFDYIASHPRYPRIVQGEMMRAGRGRSAQFERIVKQYFRPLSGKLAEVIQEGQSMGEFRPGDPQQLLLSIIAVIVFYFINAPVMRMVSGADPMSPERIAERRAAVSSPGRCSGRVRKEYEDKDREHRQYVVVTISHLLRNRCPWYPPPATRVVYLIYADAPTAWGMFYTFASQHRQSSPLIAISGKRRCSYDRAEDLHVSNIRQNQLNEITFE